MVILKPDALFTKPLAGNVEIDYAHPLAARLEAFYLFNEVGGQVRDLSGNQRHSTAISSGITRTVQPGVGSYGQSVGGQVLDFPTSGGTHQVSCGTWNFDYREQGLYCECWVWLDTNSGAQNSFFSKNTDTTAAGHEWMLGNNDETTFRGRFGNNADSTVISGTVTNPTGRWIHVAGDMRNDTGASWNSRIYLDGVYSNIGTVSYTPNAPGAATVALGNRNSTSAINGRLGMVAIWSRSFDANQDNILWRAKEPFAFLRPTIKRTYFDLMAAAAPGGSTHPGWFHSRGGWF